MHALVFLGKGGVGKTTCAVGASLALARRGQRVLLASLDPAHSVGDLLGLRLGDNPLEVEAGLRALEVDLDGRRHRMVSEIAALARRSYGHLAALGLGSMTGLLAHAPGMEEQVALEALAELLRIDETDVLVIDAPATALATRMLVLPGLTTAWLERLVKLRRAILERRGAIEHIKKGPSSAAADEDDPVMEQLTSDQGVMTTLRKWLVSGSTTLVVVVNPDTLSVREASRLVDALEPAGMRPGLWVLNRDRGGPVPDHIAELVGSGQLVRLRAHEEPLSSWDELATHGEPLRRSFGL